MSHRRKKFLVYPPNYEPFGRVRYREFYSRKAAIKQAYKWGAGAEVQVSITVHPKPRAMWQSNFGKSLFVLEAKETP